MDRLYNWSWVEAQVQRTIDVWHGCAAHTLPHLPRYSPQQQAQRELAYDQGLRSVELEAKRAPRGRADRLEAQRRITAIFPPFAAVALGLEPDAIQLLTDGFLPAGTTFARWAKRFDAAISMADVIQACRNAWTVCGLQPLLGDRMEITPSILGYSLLYPYSDNYLDHEKVATSEKLRFSQRFRDRLCGEELVPRNRHESAVWAMVRLIEYQYPRSRYPQVFACLLAIHQAQEQSIAQLKGCGSPNDTEVLRMSCAKGGTSVLADACLSHGSLQDHEARFAFEWGALLQLGDDLQDVREDLRCGSVTLFSRAAAEGQPLDHLAIQLLHLSDHVAAGMRQMLYGTSALKELLRMSWRSLILMAIANSPEFFSPPFLAELEYHSPFRFQFLRSKRKKLAGRRGLFKVLFDAFLEAGEDDLHELPHPESWMQRALDSNTAVGPGAIDRGRFVA